ncbi:MAG: CoA-binding protein [Stellaceae bacterium]
MSDLIPDSNPDTRLRDILRRARTIALVGASAKPERPSHGVMTYLQAAGYRVIPVNPGLAGRTLLGERVYARLQEIPEPIDLVDIFRKSADVPPIVEDAIAIGAKTVWMQLGIRNEAAARQAADAGLEVVEDRCTKIEHRRFAPG